jgi:hypothetical protein
MTRKSRYLLILLGFISFLILAPLIVLYIKGVSYNFKDGSFVQTGLVAFVAEPKSSEIYLNGKLSRTGSGDVNYVPAGEYQITISAPDRQDWGKRLLIQAGQVTWANPKDGKVYLFYKNPEIKKLTGNVKDFYTQDNDLIYLQNQSVIVSKVNNPQIAQNHPLPRQVNKILTADSSADNFIFVDTTNVGNPTIIFFNVSTNKILDLTALLKNQTQLQFSGNTLYALIDNVLNKVDLENKTLSPIFSDISAFYFQDDDLYLLQTKNKITELTLSRLPYNTNQTLISNLPELPSAKLYITFNKQIFIHSQNKLFLASSDMKVLEDNVTDFKFDPQNPSVAISQSGELNFYDSYTQNLNFVTRTSSSIQNPTISNSIGHAFYSTNKEILATELDIRNNQNSYRLYFGSNIEKFYVNEDGKNIILLDNGELKSLIVR